MSSGFQIGNCLCFVNGSQGLHRFDFNDQFSLHQKIQPASADCDSLINNWNGHLSLAWDGSQVQLNAEGLFVHGFKESRSQNSMDFEGSTVHFVREPIQFLIWFYIHLSDYIQKAVKSGKFLGVMAAWRFNPPYFLTSREAQCH